MTGILIRNSLVDVASVEYRVLIYVRRLRSNRVSLERVWSVYRAETIGPAIRRYKGLRPKENAAGNNAF